MKSKSHAARTGGIYGSKVTRWVFVGPAGASTTMPIFIYDTGWTGRLVGKASAASILLLLFLIILCVLYFSEINRWEKEDG